MNSEAIAYKDSAAVENTAAASAVVNRAALLDALADAAKIAEKRNNVPILGCVLLSASDDGIVVKATDLDILSVSDVIGAADPGFTVAVPVHQLLDIVKRAKASEMVAMDVEDGCNLRLDFDGLKVLLKGIAAPDFPADPDVEFDHRFSIPRTDLHRMLSKVAFAMSSEAVRYYLNGVFLHPIVTPTGSVLRAVATDGHRLSRYESPLPIGAGEMRGVIVPAKTVDHFLRLTAPQFTGKGKDKRLVGPDRVSIRVSESRIELTIGRTVINSKLIDGTFPDYARVIPNNDFVVKLKRREFGDAIRQVSVIASERGRAAKVSILDGKIRLTVSNPDSGEASMDVGADMDFGRATLSEIGFNAGYLLDLLGNTDGETVAAKFSDPGTPTHFLDPEDPSLLMVLMPMRV